MFSILQSAALPDASRPGGELRYITEHFRTLQGLRLAPFWAASLLIAIVIPLFQLSRWHATEIWIIVLVAFAAIWLPWSHAWYRRNYGTIVKPTPQPAPSGLTIAIVIFAALLIGSALFQSLDLHRGALNLWIVLLFTLPPCFYLGPPSIFIRLRRALYSAGSAALFFIPCSVLFLHPSRWFVISAVSGTLLLLSLYDHWLLHHFLHPGASEISHD
jgi:hypothetical protein